MNRALLTPPKVSSPLGSEAEVGGSKKIPISLLSRRPRLHAVSTTVGTVWPVLRVPECDDGNKR